MHSAPLLIHSLEPTPASFSASVFLAGPTSLDETGGSWRTQAVGLLQAAGFDGLIFVPEPRHRAAPADTERHFTWEAEALRCSDAILFWTPAEMATDPAAWDLWGTWKRSGKVVCGAASVASVAHQRWAAVRLRVPSAYSLAETVQLALPLLRPGASRSGGERAVPLFLWRSPTFQRWYHALRTAGNRLDDIEVEWTYRPRGQTGRPPLVFALRPKIWIKGERRHKSGEVVVGRADVSATVLYHPARRFLDTTVVLVREFRSAVLNTSGFVWELPGGSAEHAADRDHDPRVTAAREVQEETGLLLQPAQLSPVTEGVRQAAATILSHRAHLYRAALTTAQLEQLRAAERSGTCFGANPGERCYVAVRPLGDILKSSDIDWAQIGMIMAALSPDWPR